MRIFPKRKSNGERVYWCSWTEGGITIRRSTRTSTREAAELVAKRWERERADPAHAAATSATLGGEAATFLEESSRAVAPDTLDMYRAKAGHLLRLIGADTPLADITTDTVGNYFRARRLEPGAKRGSRISDGTLGLEWATLSGILRSARHRNRFHKDPASLRPLRFSSASRQVERFLSWGELTALVMTLPERRRACVLFAVATGARRAEWRRASISDVTAVGDGEWVVHLHGRKTPRSDRYIPVPPLFRVLFESVMRHADPNAPTMFDPWPSHAQDLGRACHRVAIEPASWNDIRRTFASLLVQSGESEDVVSRLMGHTSTKMVKTVYGRQTAETLRALLRDPRVTHDDATVVTKTAQATVLTSRKSDFSGGNDGEPEIEVASMRGSSTYDVRREMLVLKRFDHIWGDRSPPVNHQEALSAIQAAALAFHAADSAVST